MLVADPTHPTSECEHVGASCGFTKCGSFNVRVDSSMDTIREVLKCNVFLHCW